MKSSAKEKACHESVPSYSVVLSATLLPHHLVLPRPLQQSKIYSCRSYRSVIDASDSDGVSSAQKVFWFLLTLLHFDFFPRKVIDEITRDKLERAGFDAAALEKARSMLTSFRQFIEDNKDQIEAFHLFSSASQRLAILASRLGRAIELFGNALTSILADLDERLATYYRKEFRCNPLIISHLRQVNR